MQVCLASHTAAHQQLISPLYVLIRLLLAKTSRHKRNSGIGLPSISSINLSPSGKDKESKEKKKKKGFFSKSLISAPSAFKHIAHMGFDSEKGFTAENVDPSWERLMTQLQGMGISKSQIEENKDFIKDFVRDAEAGSTGGAPPPPPPPVQAPRGKRKQAPPAPKSRLAGDDSEEPSTPAPSHLPPPPPSLDASAPSRPNIPPPPPPRTSLMSINCDTGRPLMHLLSQLQASQLVDLPMRHPPRPVSLKCIHADWR